MSGEILDTDGPLTAVLDATPPDGDLAVLVGFINGTYSRALQEYDEEGRRNRVLDELNVLLDSEEIYRPVRYDEKSWTASRWSAGCYSGHAPAGTMTAHWETIWESVGRIHWAGSETAREWPGHMEGAVRSGWREAGNVLDRLG